MSTNYTPFSTSNNGGKGAPDTNLVLIVIALIITISLGAFMWFLITQKQQEEKKAQLKYEEQSELLKAKQATIDKLPVATPSANTSVTPTKMQITVTPVASPSARPTSGMAPSPKTVQETTTP